MAVFRVLREGRRARSRGMRIEDPPQESSYDGAVGKTFRELREPGDYRTLPRRSYSCNAHRTSRTNPSDSLKLAFWGSRGTN